MVDPGAGRAGTSDTGLVTSSLIEQSADIEDIRRLRAHSVRCIDLKRWDELGDLLTPDATFSSGATVYGKPSEIQGGAQIVDFIRARFGPGVLTGHLLSQPEITIDGDTAEGIWSLRQKVLATRHRIIVEAAGFCEEHYVRGDDRRWRIARISYIRNSEFMLSMDDLPSFRLVGEPDSAAADLAAAVAHGADPRR